MTHPVSLEALVREVMGLMYDWRVLLNTETGAVTTYFDDMVIDRDDEEDFEGPEWIEVPYPEEDSDWRTMRDFAGAQESEETRDRLWVALNGRRAFGSFRAVVHGLGLQDAWYAYQEEAITRLLKAWLVVDEIPFTEGATAARA